MREIFSDVVRQTVGLFEKIRITSTKDNTIVEAASEDRLLFLKARLNAPLSEDAEGVWGLGDLALLNGLLNYAPYCSDDASFSIKRHNGNPFGFEFKEANGSGATHRTIMGDLVGEQATIPDISWDLSLTPQKAKIAAFQQLSSLYTNVEKVFSVATKNGDLIFTIGNDNSATHHANMVFESGVTGELPAGMLFGVGQFLGIIKQAGAHPLSMGITARRAIGMTVTTPVAVYDYFVNGKR